MQCSTFRQTHDGLHCTCLCVACIYVLASTAQPPPLSCSTCRKQQVDMHLCCCHHVNIHAHVCATALTAAVVGRTGNRTHTGNFTVCLCTTVAVKNARSLISGGAATCNNQRCVSLEQGVTTQQSVMVILAGSFQKQTRISQRLLFITPNNHTSRPHNSRHTTTTTTTTLLRQLQVLPAPPVGPAIVKQ